MSGSYPIFVQNISIVDIQRSPFRLDILRVVRALAGGVSGTCAVLPVAPSNLSATA